MPSGRRPRDRGPGRATAAPGATTSAPRARARGAGGNDGRGSSRAPERQLPVDGWGLTRKSACALLVASSSAEDETLST